jgi:predicted Zn-dependent protease
MAIFFYARCLGDAGNNKQAIDYTREVLRAVPEDAEVHTLLARYYGADKQMFNANLHMAYGALYENNKKRVDQFFGKAKELAKTPDEKARVDRFVSEYKDRQEIRRRTGIQISQFPENLYQYRCIVCR